MKKILLALVLVFAVIGFDYAQTTPQAVTGLKKDGTPDMRLKANRTKKTTAPVAAQPTAAPVQIAPASTAGLKKDGTPDMRLKANKAQKQTPVAVQTAPAAINNPTAPKANTATLPQPANPPVARAASKSPDAVLQTDAKGRTIYQGPRGGKYYINKNGHKEYVK